WQVDDYVALFPVYGIELDSKFCSRVIGLPATVSSHASHISRSKAYRRETETFNVQRLPGAGGQHDRGGIRAGTSRNRFLRLHGRWNSHHHPDDYYRYPCATRVALRNRPFYAGARRVPVGEVKALLRRWSIQTTAAGK